MELYLFKKPCPTCKAQIGTGLFSNREQIVRCPKCGELLVENPKRILIGSFILFSGLVLGAGGCYLLDISLFWGILVFLVFALFSVRSGNLMIIKKDLVIKNTRTSQVSYIDHADWQEILDNTIGKEVDFEIVEKLKEVK